MGGLALYLNATPLETESPRGEHKATNRIAARRRPSSSGASPDPRCSPPAPPSPNRPPTSAPWCRFLVGRPARLRESARSPVRL